jgi:hypothetical protein
LIWDDIDLSGKAFKLVIAGIAVVVLICGIGYSVVSAVTSFSAGVSSSGLITVSSSGNYLRVSPTALNWGSIEPGSVVTQIVTITNRGTTPLTLSLVTSDWSPPTVVQYIALTWNSEKVVVKPNQSVIATLTLTVDSEIRDITSFSNSITINGRS